MFAILSICTVVFAACLVLYTSYDKAKQTIDAERLKDVVLCRLSVRYSLNELNKVIALVALVLLALAGAVYKLNYVGGVLALSLLRAAVLFVLPHSSYSMLTYLGSVKIPALAFWLTALRQCGRRDTPAAERMQAIKVCAVLCGVAAELCLVSAAFGFGLVGMATTGTLYKLTLLGCLCFAALHFYTMEMDHAWVLRVRPFGYVALGALLLGIVLLLAL
jgi:hypothetical protein